MNIKPLSDILGAEVRGVDLSGSVDTQTRKALREVIEKNLVVCFRDQQLTPEGLVDAASHFGRTKEFLLKSDRTNVVPQVSIVSNRPPGSKDDKPVVQASHWHSDDSYLKLPATLSFLNAVTLPAKGGDTEFINCYEVLKTLPPELREVIGGLAAIHVYRSRRSKSWIAPRSKDEVDESPPVSHPLIRRHPWSKRSSLYINPNRISHIDGWDDDKSDVVLDALYEHALQPCFQYRHVWRDGDLVVWDNRCTMHRATKDYDLKQLRVMHRVMLEGETVNGG